MDTKPLVEEGRKLLEHLRHDRYPWDFACWISDPDGIDWTLYMVTPNIRTDGPIEVYQKLQEAIAASGAQLTINCIHILSPTDPKAARLETKAAPQKKESLISFRSLGDEFGLAYLYDEHLVHGVG